MKIGVIGYGVVGQHMSAEVVRSGHDVIIYDKFKDGLDGEARRMLINGCDAAFVCVSTPAASNGACDWSAVADVFEWLLVPVAIIRSTIPPGTTEALVRLGIDKLNPAKIVFVPEFIGEGVNPNYVGLRQPPFLIIGGRPMARRLAGQVFNTMYNSECEQIFVSSAEAELAKYAENYFLALKVSWANEVYEACRHFGAEYESVMGAVTHDPRIGRSHTHIYDGQRGWGGRCLPKDTSALLQAAGPERLPLLQALITVNAIHRSRAGNEQ